ncbi:MAG: GMC family oxidoreductase [Rhodobacteraceae bacterium]|nr:GMC family oxidoreductase [Paracoccaceae bacterium]
MFVDARTFNDDHVERADVCIFGSGPAGMTLAYELSNSGSRVLLIEAGALSYEGWSQDLYKGDVVGDTYYDLSEARLRMFGGTSNHWGGRCLPLDAHDFEAHPDFPQTGWPISRDDLMPYLQAACDIVEIPNDFSETLYSPSVRKTTVHYSPPVRFGDKYMDHCETSQMLRVCLETALTDLVPEGGAIKSARVKTQGGSSWRVEATNFVLCLGGIENSRILLWMDASHNHALDGNRDVIGRYWMEHPFANLADVIIDTPGDGFFADGEATFALTREAQYAAGILNAGLQLTEDSYGEGTKALIADLMCAAPALGERLMRAYGKELVCGARLQSHWEQAPVRQNRVRLGQNRDALGIPTVELHWRRSETDRRTATQSARIFAKDIAQKDLGRARLMQWIRKDAPIPDQGMMAGWHHIGGTRMSDSPSDGVVDRNLKVHGLDNLYIGGSSVFPSGGYANPTLTIVQLSLRLSAHLAELM